MNLTGFNLREEGRQTVLDFVMPEPLSDIFQVSLYGRGPVLDAAGGNPSLIWQNAEDREAVSEKLIAPYQVHGTEVIYADADLPLPCRKQADGVYMERGLSVCVSLRFADCAPVVIACAGEKKWLLALHSGFAGTVRNICGAALDETLKRNASAGVKLIYAWVAPSICGKCYTRKIGDPTTVKGMASFAGNNFSVAGNYVYFDIKGEIKSQLENCGVLPDNIFISDFCTVCDNDKFYSYRMGDLDADRRNFLLAASTTKSAFK